MATTSRCSAEDCPGLCHSGGTRIFSGTALIQETQILLLSLGGGPYTWGLYRMHFRTD